MVRVSGDSMQDAGISDGSLIAVDRSLSAQHGDVMVAAVDGEFTVKQLYLRNGRCELHPANDAYPPIVLFSGHTQGVWDVVTAAVTWFTKCPGPSPTRREVSTNPRFSTKSLDKAVDNFFDSRYAYP